MSEEIKDNVSVKQKSSLFLIWLIPLLAIAIASFAIYQHFSEKGVNIYIEFDSADGLEVGKTELKYRGIAIGHITDITVKQTNLDKIIATVSITHENAKELIPRAGVQFWLVKPEITLSGITGLSTVLSGVYIACNGKHEVIKSKTPLPEDVYKLPKKYHFVALQKQPPDAFYNLGKIVYLKSKNGQYMIGSPILYKRFQIGKIIDSKLDENTILLTVSIDNRYSYLLNSNSRFWNINAIELKASLANVNLSVGSLEELIGGAIAMSSPKDGDAVEDESVLELFQTKEQSTMAPGVLILSAQSGYNLTPGISKVFHNGVEAGIVQNVTHDVNQKGAEIRIKLYERYMHLLENNTYFWINEPELDLYGIKNLDAIATGSYISFSRYHNSTINKRGEFILHEVPPPILGKPLTLYAKELGALKRGSGIFFEGVQIGSINTATLLNKHRKVKIDVVIYDKYVELINDSTLFFLNSGITFNASITSGVNVNVGSLKELIRGGISVDTINTSYRSTKTEFPLIESYDAYLKEKYYRGGGKTYTLTTNDILAIKQGTPVYYKTMKVGEVKDHAYDSANDAIKVYVYIEPEYASTVNDSTKFYEISGLSLDASLSKVKVDIQSLDTLAKGGIAYQTPHSPQHLATKKHFKLYDDKESAFADEFTVTIRMNNAYHIKEGSLVTYKNFAIGKVNKMSFDGTIITAYCSIESKYRKLITQDSRFSLERFHASLDGIKNIGTLVTGDTLALYPGKSKTFSDTFELYLNSPSPLLHKEGLRIVLKGSRKSSLQSGSPVYYRQFQIGEVEEVVLGDDASTIDFLVYINPCYAYLVRENSLFYNATALGFDVSLTGIKVETETLQTLLNGGIGMIIPENYAKASSDAQQFYLYDTPDPEWLNYRPKISNSAPSQKCKQPTL